MHEQRLDIGDWTISCQTTSSEVSAEIGRVLGPAPAGDGSTPDFVVTAEIGSAVRGSTKEWRRLDHDPPLALWATETGTALEAGTSLAEFTGVDAVLRFASIGESREWMHTFLTAAINHFARTRNIVPAHSALVGFGGTWLLLLGPSGVGKSTASLAVSLHGGRVAADDTCLLRVVDGRLQAHGLPRAPSLPLADHGIDDDRPTDHRSRTSDASFDLAIGWHDVAGAVVLQHGTAPQSTATPASATDVIRATVDSVPASLGTHTVVSSVPEVMQHVAGLPAATVHLGVDASQRLASLSARLRELADRLGDRT